MVTAVLAVATVLVATALTGAVVAPALLDPGALVRWSLPAVGALADLSAALTVGALLLATVALPVTTVPGAVRPLAEPSALRLACAAATAWAVTTVLRAVLGYADLAGRSLGDPVFGTELGSFLRDLDLGRGFLVTATVAVAVSLLAAGARTARAAGLLTVLALVGLIPAALTGHAASSGGHETAVTSLGLHLLGVSGWVGGLLALVLLRRGLGAALPVVARRYSGVAGWAFLLVATSGVINVASRLEIPADLATPYGLLVVAKAAALVLLGLAGWWHRRRTLPELAGPSTSPPITPARSRPFLRLALVEIWIMAVATGLAAALARTPPPTRQLDRVAPSPAEVVTGHPLPPRPEPMRMIDVWQPDLLWVLVTAVLAVLYLAGVVRLARRGDRWPLPRTLVWLAGLAVVGYVTCGAPAAYGRVLFSAHMVAHMTLTMVAPPLLVLGAPVTLASRTLRPRRDGTRGPRELLLAAVGSPTTRVLTHPVLVAVLFAGSLVLFYYSGLFELALTTHVGHELMYAHFLLAGYLFAWVLIGIDPGPRRPAYPLRVMLLFATMAFHAFFGVSLVSGTEVLAADHFGALGRDWGRDLLADQRYGGGIAWGLGEVPTLFLVVAIVVLWARSDEREARRRDRAADRDGDAELEAYNARLAALARRHDPRAR